MGYSCRVAFAFLCATLYLHTNTQAAHAQETPADTAAVLVSVARTLEAEGRPDLAEDLLSHVIRRYPGSAAAGEAAERLARLERLREGGGGRVQFALWNTLFASWLGLAVPAAFGAEGPEPFGAGLLIGAPAGFFASRAYARSRPLTSGQAGAFTLATAWGTWQAVGWRAVLDIGEERFCSPEFCFSSTPGEAVWKAVVVGGVAGLASGLVLGGQNISPGDIALADHSALWGSWYGFASGVLLDLDGDDRLAAALIGGNAGILAAIPFARSWSPASGRVHMISISGVAGGVAGLGLSLLLQVEDEKLSVAIPTVTATAGLLAGAVLAEEDEASRADASDIVGGSLLSLDGGLHLRLPVPTPAAVPAVDMQGRWHLTPALQIDLFEAVF